MAGKIYLFPDTNLFVQCKPLPDLDWSAWKDYDEVLLYISRPVQAEVDSQKGKGNSRLATRARKTSSLFREILKLGVQGKEVCASKPRVNICHRQDLKRDESLADDLCYDERDDQLVGIAALFAKNNPDDEVRILTHDTGPMASAQMVGVEFHEIPDSWLLPPEADESEKKMRKLQEEVDRLRKAEPAVEARLESGTSYQAERLVFEPLDDAEIAAVMKKIMSLFPMATDFEPEKKGTHEADMGFRHLRGEVFVPATEADFAKYKDELYSQWVNDCESILCTLHQKLNVAQEALEVTVWLSNIGSRPADDALVNFLANGGFQIQPPSKKDAEDEDEAEQKIRLPNPPAAPRGYWKKSSIYGLAERFKSVNIADLSPLLSPLGRQKDPNRFYYQNKPKWPVDSFSLGCQQWRHQGEEEGFDLILHVESTPSVVTGALEVKVQAANMTDPLVETYPIRITLKEASTLEQAEELIEWLTIEG